MKRALLALAALAAFSAPALAASYIPLGPKVYTPQPDLVIPQPDVVVPQPDLVTPQPDTVTVIPGEVVRTGPTNNNAGPEFCFTADMFGNPFKNGEQCHAATSISETFGSYKKPDTTKVTKNPDLVTPQPDLVIPQPDVVIPQPDKCTQRGWSRSGGFGNYDC